MKRLFVFIVLTVTATLVYGQKSIDDLFEKYAGRDGFTTVTLNGNLLKLAHCLNWLTALAAMTMKTHFLPASRRFGFLPRRIRE